jgi:Type II secretion system (T2SS), protein M subtype b
MADLQATRRKIKIVLGVMLALDLGAAVVLFSPLVGSAESRRFQKNSLAADLTRKNREVQPLRGMDKKVDLAKKQIPEFYAERFAARGSDIDEELGKIAVQNGVKIQQMKYKQEDPETAGIVPVEIQGSFSGDYLQLVRFINSLERSKLFITVDGVDLASEGAGPVKLNVTMHSYLRSGA